MQVKSLRTMLPPVSIHIRANQSVAKEEQKPHLAFQNVAVKDLKPNDIVLIPASLNKHLCFLLKESSPTFTVLPCILQTVQEVTSSTDTATKPRLDFTFKAYNKADDGSNTILKRSFGPNELNSYFTRVYLEA